MNQRSIAVILAVLTTAIVVPIIGAIKGIEPIQQNEPVYFNADLAKKNMISYNILDDEQPLGKTVEDVSLIKLISTPEQFHKHAIRIKGYLRIGHREDNAIYLSKDDADYSIYRNGFWIHIDYDEWEKQNARPLDFNNKYIAIEGLFDKDLVSHPGTFSGGFSTIWRAYVLKISR